MTDMAQADRTLRTVGDVHDRHRALVRLERENAPLETVLTEAQALVTRLKGMAIHPSHYASLEVSIAQAKGQPWPFPPAPLDYPLAPPDARPVREPRPDHASMPDAPF